MIPSEVGNEVLTVCEVKAEGIVATPIDLVNKETEQSGINPGWAGESAR